MSLLTICQNVALQTGFPSLTTVASNQGETARRLFALANLEGRTLARRFNFSALEREYTFNTANGQADYDFPADFDRFIPTTMWDRGMFWALQGPLTPQEWQVYKSGIIQSSPRRKWRVTPVAGVPKFSVWPVPGDVDELVFEYISKNWVRDNAGNLKATFTADTDEAIISEYLIELGTRWRFLNALGLSYAEEKLEYERECDKMQARDGGSRILSMGPPKMVGPNVPDAGFGQQ